MYETAYLERVMQDEYGTHLYITIPDRLLQDTIIEKRIRKAEMRFDDGRHISIDQRKKAYATINDIALWTGNVPEAEKEDMKYEYIKRTGRDYISLSNCTMDEAREFINVLMEFAIENGVPLSERGIERTDDIGKYLYYCIKHRKCCICGRPGEIHHVDTIGMGNDRKKVDDSSFRKMCLCREHHTIAHQRGMTAFEKMYKVYGIVIKEDIRLMA
ncbi:putative HNHc nuclease [Murimonas intestini]|uniref:putative HNHc nuclease n=1 Tax=Murimonas intestini TaxID=1337051 RepID=UPI002ED411F0